MVKLNAEKQRDYRERKKLEGPDFLEKQRKRQKDSYVKTSSLSKKELQERRIAVKERVQRSRDRKKAVRKKEQIQNEISYASSSTEADTDQTMSPSSILVSIPFPKRGEAFRKRKPRSDDRLYKKIKKLENEKRKPQRKCESLPKKIFRSSKKKGKSSTLNIKKNKLMRGAEINHRDAPEIQKQLLFAETLSSEIREAGKEKKNSKQSIRSVISGKIFRKYKLIHYAKRRTNTDRRKLSKGLSMVINPNEKNEREDLYKAVINFYNRDDVSIALPGKRNAIKIKQVKPRIQKRVLNNYLSNLHQKSVYEHTNMSCSLASFARMRPKNFVLANFANRRTCLCTQHQNDALKLKMLRKYTGIPTNPKAFIIYSDQKISSIIDNIKQQDFTYDIWKKLCKRAKHPKNENDHSNHQSYSIQSPFAKEYSDISQPY